MTHRLTTNCAKNYGNRTLIVKVIVENVVACFLGTQCSKFGRHTSFSYWLCNPFQIEGTGDEGYCIAGRIL